MKKKKLAWANTRANIRAGLKILDHRWSTAKNVKRRKWRQVKKRCGHAAINNAIGGSDEVVTVERLDHYVSKLNDWNDTTMYGSALGDYHIKAMQLACEEAGYKLRKVVNEHGAYPTHMTFQTICTEGRYIAIGYAGKEPHWFAIDADNSLVIDSATAGFIKLNPAGILKACNTGIRRVYRLTRKHGPVAKPTSVTTSDVSIKDDEVQEAE